MLLICLTLNQVRRYGKSEGRKEKNFIVRNLKRANFNPAPFFPPYTHNKNLRFACLWPVLNNAVHT